MKYLRIASDLHLEWRRDVATHDAVLPEDELDKESILVLAGDIGQGRPLLSFIGKKAKRHPRVVYIPGNHEYYGCQSMEGLNTRMETTLSAQYPNVVSPWGNVLQFQEGDTSFITSTMWTDCDRGNPISMQNVMMGLADFTAIPKFTPGRMMAIHANNRAEIVRHLREAKEKKLRSIVITHHMPSFKLITNPKYVGSTINAGFAANCLDILESDYAPAVWIFGHTHDRMETFLGNTMCICNPLGHPNEDSGLIFEHNLFLDISKPVPEFV